MADEPPRLLVIGSRGFLGSWVCRLGAPRFAVLEGARRGEASDGPAAVSIDITDDRSVQAAFRAARPAAVILTAALADIDLCEREPRRAAAVNFEGPRRVAEACRQHAARLLFTSSDAVFDGSQRAYLEDDAPTPLNEYGRTKARAEAAIREILPTAAIVRVSLVLGRAPRSGTNSYLDKLAATLGRGESIRVPTSEYRNPIDVATLAQTLVELAAHPAASGIYHVGASDKLSRFELARRLAAELGCRADLIEPQDSPPAGRAPRGLDDFLVCRRLPELLPFVVPTCQQVIQRAVHAAP